MTITDHYLASVKKQFHLYKALGEKAINQLEPSQLFVVHNDNSNSIGVIIKHMHGNMMSRWTDFLSTDGEKPWRKRDEEFENDLTGEVDVLQLWVLGWECFF